jgi:hypothetical protein
LPLSRIDVRTRDGSGWCVRTTLITTFAVAPDEEQLNNLTLWLDQAEFSGFEAVDYRFEYSLEGTIRCRVPGDLPTARLARLASAIDEALTRIVSELGPRTEPASPGR